MKNLVIALCEEDRPTEQGHGCVSICWRNAPATEEMSDADYAKHQQTKESIVNGIHALLSNIDFPQAGWRIDFWVQEK